jgi:predicted ribosome quality control (RQC) complex YloA/Tae2 family protein
MHVDAMTVAALADELRDGLLSARVEDVIQPTPQSVALQCYRPGRTQWLLVSAHPQLARAHLVGAKPRKLTAEPSPFVMLLRKHLEGARAVAITQPRWERVLEIGFARGAADGESGPVVWLVAEIMGRLSNLILRDERGEILGALHTVAGNVNRYRTIMPHVAYQPPPPQTRTLHGGAVPRLAPEEVTGADLREAALETLAPTPEQPAVARPTGKRAKREEPTTTSLLMAHVAGWSRELGREVAARALGAPDAPLSDDLPWDDIAAAVRELAALPETHAWRPTLVYARGEEESAPTAFAVYEPQQYGDMRLQSAPSVNAMLASYFEGAEWRTALGSAKSDLRHLLQTHRDRCLRKEQALRTELEALGEAGRLREEADILLAFQSEAPPHVTSVTLPNPFAAEGAASSAVTLTLDPRYTAVENANRRYARYHKLQRAAGQIPPQLEANTLELARIAQLQTDLELAETPAEIAHVRQEVAEAGYIRAKLDPKLARKPSMQGKLGKAGKNGKGGKPGKGRKPGQPGGRAPEGGTPLKRQSSDGFTLLVGKNSRQNEEVTFRQASGNDLWLHARGVPGAHVIIKSGGRPVPETTIQQAAALAAYYSQSRAAGTVPVDVTEQRYVRHMKGGGPGMVIYERERTLYATPREV